MILANGSGFARTRHFSVSGTETLSFHTAILLQVLEALLAQVVLKQPLGYESTQSLAEFVNDNDQSYRNANQDN
jgi:hypothetical protein